MAEMSENNADLTKSMKDRIERNRQKAIAIKQSRLVSHPYAKNSAISIDKTTIKIGTTKYKDTGGGFLLEEEPKKETVDSIVIDEPPIFEPDRPQCIKCEKTFGVSWLFDNFNYRCCDECKDPDEHKLITKTEALNMYLLKECDLDKREPPLKFITRKNPHNIYWCEIKLYLQIQVEERAIEVWGSEEELEAERERREEKRVVTKAKKYQKHLKELRMNMRSSLFDRTSSASHQHEFGEEIYNEEDDTYCRKCKTCSYEESYEKM